MDGLAGRKDLGPMGPKARVWRLDQSSGRYRSIVTSTGKRRPQQHKFNSPTRAMGTRTPAGEGEVPSAFSSSVAGRGAGELNLSRRAVRVTVQVSAWVFGRGKG